MPYALRQQQHYPDVVTDSYLHSIMMAGIVAAHETTANSSANALKTLLERPEVWRELCEDPSLIPNAVEECLRHDAPVVAWRRMATKAVVIDGVDIPPGAKLLMIIASANHDERRFPQPDMFDIRRENSSDHLTFGYGSHQCMGKNLARMEIQVFVEEFTRRLPHMKLTEQTFSYLSNTSFHGPEHLWVEWDPQRNPERLDRRVLESRLPMRLGEPSKASISRSMRVEIVEPVAEGVVKLKLVSADGRPVPRWSPGSHIDLECGATGISRQYSLCGDPDDTDSLQIAVLFEAASRGGSRWVHGNVGTDALVKLRGPRNHFHLDESASRLVFVAGGIGITPIMAMAQRALRLGIEYTLHYCGRRRGTMAFLNELQSLHGERLSLHVSSEGNRLRVVEAMERPAPGTRVYACGPLPLLKALDEASAAWPADTLRVEHFSTEAKAFDPTRDYPFEVELKDSGLLVTVAADQTMLSALRELNIDVQSDCEEGLCGSCEVRVLAGDIDHRDVVLTHAERDANTRMMSCCSRARGGKLIVDL